MVALGVNGRPVLEVGEIDLGAWRRRRRSAGSLSSAEAMPHVAAPTISNVIADLTNLNDLPAPSLRTSIAAFSRP